MIKLRSIFNDFFAEKDKVGFLGNRFQPRWMVVLLDTLIGVSSFIITMVIIKSVPVRLLETLSLFEQGFVMVMVNFIFFFVFETYSGIIRHSAFRDIIKLALASLCTFISLMAVNQVFGLVNETKIFFTISITLYVLISFILMVMIRVLVKEGYQYLKNISITEVKRRVAIIGVDDDCVSIGRAMVMKPSSPFRLVGFITNKLRSGRYKILGKPVYLIDGTFKRTLEKLNLDAVILIGESLSLKWRNKVINECLSLNLEILNAPSMQSWNTKIDIRKVIKPLQIEDLLDRPEIRVDDDRIQQDLKGKTILVTGGAGSIGSEIVRQLEKFAPKLVVILDQAETALYELEQELRHEGFSTPIITELADISNMYRMENMFQKYPFDLIYHAAAYKHVPIIERNTHEAIYVNILGTVNLAILAMKYEIQKFVMISTDKAVNPTNVMGASKRLAEMYVQSLHDEKGVYTRFITTRFGNVLGSSGSVIPHFKKQIEYGGPVTVTHKDITRNFMTISEAGQLVLQAGAMGKGGEIFVFEMGKPINILDLAEKMIRLSGLEPYKDIQIEIIGLRPGEKLYEELLSDSATTLPTHHPKILISKESHPSFGPLNKKIKELIRTAAKHDDTRVVSLLKELVPEFKSENSIFGELDSNREVGD